MDLAQRFFPGTDPIGKGLRVGPHTYEVVGVGKPQGTVFGQSLDSYVWIPLGTYAKTWLRGGDSIFILVQAVGPERMEDAQDEVRSLMRARRHLGFSEDDNFGIIAPSSITSLWERLTANIFQVAVGLTSVFLVVGGIVIMNIMLASVVERTREIGIRKALGALRRHIIMQFLVESAVLSAMGGIIGVGVAMGIAGLVRAVFEFPVVTPLYAVVLALSVSTGVGLFFGIYPARRAARLDPIEALRQEV
jgi:putative ABC transport system permease protein